MKKQSGNSSNIFRSTILDNFKVSSFRLNSTENDD